MDDIAVLPNPALQDFGPVCRAFLAQGITTYGEVAHAIKAWPYAWPDPAPRSIGECLDLAAGTCTEKHAVAATCAEELGLPVHKAVGIYPMDACLVPGIAPLLGEWGISALPTSHCFLVYGHYRVDLTEGNCNGKTGTIDRYWQIHQVEPLPDRAELDTMYQEFLDTELARFLPLASQLTKAQWLELKRQCNEVLRLALACKPNPHAILASSKAGSNQIR